MSAPTVHEHTVLTAGAAQHTGAMIALVPTDEDCARLAIDGYEPANMLHTTLVFLGDAADWDNQSRDILEGAIRELETAKALRGDVWAHAQFNPNGTDPCAVYLVGAPGIEDIHSAVQGAVEESADWFPQIPDQHTPWVPHITAGYSVAATELTDTGPVTFDRIRLSFADEDIRDIALSNLSDRLVAAAESGHMSDRNLSEWPHRMVECQEPHTIPSNASTAPLSSADADPGYDDSAEPASTNGSESESPSRTSTAVNATTSFNPRGASATKFDATTASSSVTEMRRIVEHAKSELQTRNSASAETQHQKPGVGHGKAAAGSTPAVGAKDSDAPNSNSSTSKPSSKTRTTGAQFANARSSSTQVNSAPLTPPTSTTVTTLKPSEGGSAPHAIAASGHSETTPNSSQTPSDTSPNEKTESNSPTYRSGVALTAGADVPVLPPKEWFENPQLDGPTPLTVTPDGRVFGTLAAWETCHVGFANQCVTPPLSETDYAYFCNGVVLTDEGTDIRTGRITMGTGHAGLKMKPRIAAAHYDDTGTCVADVTAGEDEHGIWVAGAIRPGTSEEQLRALRASPLSGDWREINGNLELVAALAVNVPGFPIPRPKVLAASGYRSLTAAGVVPVTHERKIHESNSVAVTPEDRARAQFFSAPELTASISREVRAARIRESRSETLAARIRATRMDAATRRITLAAQSNWPGTKRGDTGSRLAALTERMSAITAAGRHRRVETPEGAEHYGQPVGSIIITDPPAPEAAPKTARRDKKADPLPKGFEKKYKGTDIDTVPKKDMYGITQSLCEWNSWSNYQAEKNPDTQGLMRGNLNDYDIAATETDLIRDGINASFLHTGVGPGGEYEIDPDGEFAQMGQLFNDALERNRRDDPRPTDPDIFGPARNRNDMSNAEIAELYADISILTGHDLDVAAMPGLVADVARRGLNVRAALPDSTTTPEVRAQILGHLNTIIGQESGN